MSERAHNPAQAETVSEMSKAQKRGNREIKKPKSVKKVEQPTVSSSLTKAATTASDQLKKKR
jgi:hypothetical protein